MDRPARCVLGGQGAFNLSRRSAVRRQGLGGGSSTPQHVRIRISFAPHSKGPRAPVRWRCLVQSGGVYRLFSGQAINLPLFVRIAGVFAQKIGHAGERLQDKGAIKENSSCYAGQCASVRLGILSRRARTVSRPPIAQVCGAFLSRARASVQGGGRRRCSVKRRGGQPLRQALAVCDSPRGGRSQRCGAGSGARRAEPERSPGTLGPPCSDSGTQGQKSKKGCRYRPVQAREGEGKVCAGWVCNVVV